MTDAQKLRDIDLFNKKAEGALNYEFGHKYRTFQHVGGPKFDIQGRDHSIPGEPERPGAYAVQLLPEGELDNGELGFFGHTVEVGDETFQVNWLW